MAKKARKQKTEYRVVAWSGGKDSTATIILAHILGIPIDEIIISLVWFDKKRGISGESTKHLRWIMDFAIPLFESWGYTFLGFIYNPAVKDEDHEEPKEDVTEVNTSGIIKVGDIVEFTGTKHYASSNALTGPACRPGKARVTATYKGRHPYHLVAVSGGGSTVYGWVNVSDIDVVKTAVPVEEEYVPQVGDIVMYNGNTHYTSAYSTNTKFCKGGLAKVTAIYRPGKSKHPYHLVRISGKGATVYGWVDEGTFTEA